MTSGCGTTSAGTCSPAERRGIGSAACAICSRQGRGSGGQAMARAALLRSGVPTDRLHVRRTPARKAPRTSAVDESDGPPMPPLPPHVSTGVESPRNGPGEIEVSHAWCEIRRGCDVVRGTGSLRSPSPRPRPFSRCAGEGLTPLSACGRFGVVTPEIAVCPVFVSPLPMRGSEVGVRARRRRKPRHRYFAPGVLDTLETQWVLRRANPVNNASRRSPVRVRIRLAIRR
jgi:hypothetical protein